MVRTKEYKLLNHHCYFSEIESLIVNSINKTFFNSENVQITSDDNETGLNNFNTYTFLGSKNLDFDYIEIAFKRLSDFLEIDVMPTNNDPILINYVIDKTNSLESICNLYSKVKKPFKAFPNSYSSM